MTPMISMIRIFLVSLICCIATGLAVPDTGLAQPPGTVKSSASKSKTTPHLLKMGKDQLVSIDFNGVDIRVFIKFISDLTKKNFVINDRVKGKVTIISPGKITVNEAYQVFESVLEIHGFAAVPAGEIIKIVPSPDARSKNIKTRITEEAGVAGDTVVTQIIPLRYADPNEIKRLFTPLVSKNSVIQAYPPTNTLIITDVHSNIKRLLHILKAIDVTGVGQQIAIIPIEYADAGKLVTLLNSIFTSKKRAKGATRKDITFVADERTNVIVILASEGDTDNIRKLVRSLDKETPKGQAKIHVYYLEHATAEDLAKVLQDIPQKEASGKKAGKKLAPVVSDKVRISADKATNSLIIMADMEDYQVLEGIIRKIDIPRAMVYIEALIMEVNVNKDFRLGTEWVAGSETTIEDEDAIYGGGFSAGSFLGDSGTLGTTLNAAGAPLAPGFSLGLFGDSITVGGITFPTISAIIQAYKKDRDVEILSTPQILTTDNQEAKIYVGKNVPFQTTATASSTGSEVYNSYEYRDVGKTLKITPHINKDRMVRLELSLEITDLESATDNRPTTLKRTVETTAIVRDRNTVVLGGLIDDRIDKTVYKVPCLGSIPGLGLLFTKKANADEKTNLYIFLTPRVIQNSEEASKVSNIKRSEIDRLREQNIKLYEKGEKKTSPAKPGKPKVESYDYHEESQIPADSPSGDELTVETEPPSPIGADTASGSAMDSTASSPETQILRAEKDILEEGVEPHDAASVELAENRKMPIESKVPLSIAAETDTQLPNPEPKPQAVLKSAYPTQRENPNTDTEPSASDIDTRANPGKQPTSVLNSAPGNQVEGYTVQVAAVQDAQSADEMLKQLVAHGYAAYTVQSTAGSKTWYRLRIGYYDQPATAKEIIARLRSDRYDPILIKF